MGVSYMSVVICAAAEKIKGRNEVRSKNLDDCAALENWLITKSDDNGLDYLSNITAYIAELEAVISSGFQNLNGSDVASALIDNADLRDRIAELEQAESNRTYTGE